MTPIALHKNDMPGQLSKHRKFQVSSFELHVCFFRYLVSFSHISCAGIALFFPKFVCVGKNKQMKQPVAMKSHVFVL